jgi:hypothetical protein
VVAEEAALSSSLSPSSWASSQIEHGRVAVVDPADPAGGEECDSKVVECWECRMFKAIRERRARKVLGPRGLSARGRHQKEREERRKSACCDKDALEGNSEQDLVDDDDMDLEVVEEEEESEDCEEWLPGGRREPGWVCEICDEGGKLVLCDACGKGFHAKCLGIESVETLPDEGTPCAAQIEAAAEASLCIANEDPGRGSCTGRNIIENPSFVRSRQSVCPQGQGREWIS